MAEDKSLKDMNMGELWALAKSKGIEIKGKKKVALIDEILKADGGSQHVPSEEKPKLRSETEKDEKPKAKRVAMVEVTLSDGSKALVPAESVTAPEAVEGGEVTIRSVDGRELELSIGRDHWKGKEIVVPVEIVDEVKRILKEGGFYFI